ncbi:hypothetical protein ACN6KF_003060 [Labrys sp. La1]|uniref:hypothetical protein n=1 Tax=Labrys sp. La1 TaxID=3404917 RepID=UPI003EB70887
MNAAAIIGYFTGVTLDPLGWIVAIVAAILFRKLSWDKSLAATMVATAVAYLGIGMLLRKGDIPSHLLLACLFASIVWGGIATVIAKKLIPTSAPK